MLQQYTLDDAAHLIQVALTPVFLLSGIGALLNVFAGRLARVADQLTALTTALKSGDATDEQNEKLALLRRRSLILDVAVVLATAGAAATCLAIMTLFLFALSNKAIASILLLFFGGAVLCTLGAVVAFGIEMVLSNRAMRRRIAFQLPHLHWRRHQER
jgi:MFS family permease